jgi:invasion protein IalB
MKKLTFVRQVLVTLIAILPATNIMAQEAIEMQGPTSLSETYDAWTVQCANQQQGDRTQRICQMMQELLQQETRQRVMTFAIGKTENGAKATLILPFGLLLSEGFRVQVGEEEVLRGSYRTCLPAGCLAEIDLVEEMITKLGGAETATVTMTANNGQPVKTDISLEGFKAAYERLTGLAVTGK